MKTVVKDYLKGFDPEKHELYAKSNCNKCYGRGSIGQNITHGEPQPCTCLRMRLKAVEVTV